MFVGLNFFQPTQTSVKNNFEMLNVDIENITRKKNFFHCKKSLPLPSCTFLEHGCWKRREAWRILGSTWTDFEI